jgi:acetyl-CoA synthetase
MLPGNDRAGSTFGQSGMSTTESTWQPRAEDIDCSNVARLMRRHGIASTTELRERAAREPGWFYPAIIEDLGVEWSTPYDRLLDDSNGLPWTDWFIGGRLNIVHNVLDRHVRAGHGHRVAVIGEGEDGNVTTLSYGELDRRVTRFAGALAGLGLGVGDAVGFYLPMTADVVVALLACLKIGAVPVPVFAGFGPDALATRLSDAEARVLLTADGTVRRGKTVHLKGVADAACALAPVVQHVVVLRRTGETIPWKRDRDLWWHELEKGGPSSRETTDLDASARSLILYTSGTTGRPKGAVHTHGGVQLVTAKEAGYHLDIRTGDVMFWLTDIGWMMGPWEILGTLFHRGTVVLLDGAPDFPEPDRLWAMVERHRVTHLAVAPTVVRMLAGHGEELVRRHDLSSVRILGSTGEPWDETSYAWYFGNVGGGRCPVINISGGTELMGCLLAPLPTAPIKACSLQGPALGMDVDVFDEEGRPVRGEVGYLVCQNAAPNMTRGFLGDRQRYLDTYFARFGERIWCHGDWALVDGGGAWFITGRADDTLKIAGKRVGPGEVEAAAISHPAVREAAAVGLPDEVKGTRLVLVVVPSSAVTPEEALTRDVSRHVEEHLGAALRPSGIVWIPALPVTRSGKIVRALIARVLAGQDPGVVANVANPESLDALASRAAELGA